MPPCPQRRRTHPWRALALAALASLAVPPALAAELSVVCGRNPIEHRLCREAAEEWGAANGHQVRVAAAPGESKTRLAAFEELLEVGSPELDVLEIDVVWPALLAAHLQDLAAPLGADLAGFDPRLIEANRVAGRVVAAPWFMDFGILYYRADLLDSARIRVPSTWDELETAAVRIQDGERAARRDQFWGYLWQGWQYEGLTCNAMEWLGSWGGGGLVDARGTVTAANPWAEYALKRPTRWLGLISPESVLVYTEAESLAAFREGNAAFLRHWPGAWAELQAADSPVRGKVGFTHIPRGGPRGTHAATLGGWQLAVSRYSRHPQLAVDLVRHMTGPAVQRRRAIAAALVPTRPALLQEAAVREALPFVTLLTHGAAELVLRPASVTGADYGAVSNALQARVTQVLEGRLTGERAVQLLADDLEHLKEAGTW